MPLNILVNGGWGDWGQWSECPVSCGGREITRARVCKNPAPQFVGADCVGDATETVLCNKIPCPSKLILYLIHS